MVKPAETYALRRPFLAVELALVMLIAFLLVRAVMAFSAPESLWTEIPSTVIAVDQTRQSQTGNFNAGFDPFHRSVAAVVPVDTGSDAPETSLNLKLTGLRAGADGVAFLQTPDNKQRAYRIDEEIISGVTLHSVSPNFVVLSLGGRLERLTFAREQENTLLAATPQTGSQVVTLSTPQVSTKITPQSFMSSVKLDGVVKKGRLQGFRISARNPSVDLSAFGLQDGDIITKVGGTDLTSGQPDIASLATSLRRKSSTEVTLLRGGRSLTLKVGS